MKKEKYIIVAVDENYGIGKDNKLPWSLKGDMKFFKEKTLQVKEKGKHNAVVMGRKTWESLPGKYRPLPDRINVVLTTKPNYTASGATVCGSIDEAIDLLEGDEMAEKIFFIGGAEIFNQALAIVDGIYITEIKSKFDCDKFFPEIPEYFEDVKKLGSEKENGIGYDFMLYKNVEND